MGTKQSQETENLIHKRTFVLHCEHEDCKKQISVTDNGLQFPMKRDIILIPYAGITKVKHHKMWPAPFNCENFIHIETPDAHYYFSGADSAKLEKAISSELPEIETLL